MRILFVCGAIPPTRCGVGDYTVQLARSLAAQPGTEVALLVAEHGAPPDAVDGVHLLTIPDWRAGRMQAALGTIRRFQPDVIHFQYPSQGFGKRILPELLPLVARRLLHIPVVQTWHEFWHPLRFYRAVRVAACDAAVFVRPEFEAWMPDWVRRLLKGRPARLIQSASTIPQSRMSLDQRRAMNAQLGYGKRVAAYFGFALPSKGIEDLFAALDPAHWQLLLICDLDPSNRYHASLRTLAEQSAWRSAVTITGFQPPQRVADLLAAADVVVLPFRAGGGEWNTSIHAAQRQGTPVVTTRTSGTGCDMQNGIVYVAPSNPVALSEGVLCAISSVSAPAFQATPCAWDEIALEHHALYSSVLHDHAVCHS